eukprot:UN18177
MEPMDRKIKDDIGDQDGIRMKRLFSPPVSYLSGTPQTTNYSQGSKRRKTEKDKYKTYFKTLYHR